MMVYKLTVLDGGTLRLDIIQHAPPTRPGAPITLPERAITTNPLTAEEALQQIAAQLLPDKLLTIS